jgi:hypothetical protein
VVVVFVVSDSLTKEALSSVIELKGEREHMNEVTQKDIIHARRVR